MLIGNVVAESIRPTEAVAGSTVTGEAMAGATSSFPAPAAAMRAVAPLSRMLLEAVFTSADLICAGVKLECTCFTSAAAPAAKAAEKLVPRPALKPDGSYKSPFGS